MAWRGWNHLLPPHAAMSSRLGGLTVFRPPRPQTGHVDAFDVCDLAFGGGYCGAECASYCEARRRCRRIGFCLLALLRPLWTLVHAFG